MDPEVKRRHAEINSIHLTPQEEHEACAHGIYLAKRLIWQRAQHYQNPLMQAKNESLKEIVKK